MNNAVKAGTTQSQACFGFIRVRSSSFHSSPVLERKRRTNWESKSNQFSRRYRRLHAKQTLLRNVNAYADILFQRWRDGANEDEPFVARESWFRNYWTRGPGSERNGKQRSQCHLRRGFQFCEDDDDDVDTVFKSAFGGSGFFYWSFIRDEDPYWWGNPRSHSSRYQRFEFRRDFSDRDSDSSSESDTAGSASASDRLALGLKASGPLKIEDVKNAYRACALKWHPDRHQGSSKAVAEEKFKLCSAAYQSLCDTLAVN